MATNSTGTINQFTDDVDFGSLGNGSNYQVRGIQTEADALNEVADATEFLNGNLV